MNKLSLISKKAKTKAKIKIVFIKIDKKNLDFIKKKWVTLKVFALIACQNNFGALLSR